MTKDSGNSFPAQEDKPIRAAAYCRGGHSASDLGRDDTANLEREIKSAAAKQSWRWRKERSLYDKGDD